MSAGSTWPTPITNGPARSSAASVKSASESVASHRNHDGRERTRDPHRRCARDLRSRSKGEVFDFTYGEGIGSTGEDGIRRVDVNYPGFAQDMNVGDTVLVDSGLIRLEVLEIEASASAARSSSRDRWATAATSTFPAFASTFQP